MDIKRQTENLDLKYMWILEYQHNGTRIKIEYAHGGNTDVTNYQAFQAARHEKDKLAAQGISVILYHLISSEV